MITTLFNELSNIVVGMQNLPPLLLSFDELRVANVDEKATRKGKQERTRRLAEKRAPRRQQEAADSKEEQRKRQEESARRVLSQRGEIKTQERIYIDPLESQHGDKPKVLRNDNLDHLRTFALVCYTRGFDKILVEMSRNPGLAPFQLLVDNPDIRKDWPRLLPGLAFFNAGTQSDWGDGFDGGVAMVEPSKGCEIVTLSYENKDDEEQQLIHLELDLAVAYDNIGKDDDYNRLEDFLDTGFTRMHKFFMRNFSPWIQWVGKDHSFLSKLKNGEVVCKPLRILFSGKKGDNVDSEMMSNRMLSASYDFDTAVYFTGSYTSEPDKVWHPKGIFVVLVLDPDVEVINVHAATSLVDDNFLCFPSECEIILEMGCSYLQIADLDDFEAEKQEWETIWDEIKDYPPAKVEFRRVLSPRKLRAYRL